MRKLRAAITAVMVFGLQTWTHAAAPQADRIVLDRNLFETPADVIDQTQVLLTIFDGKVVYRMPAAAQ